MDTAIAELKKEGLLPKADPAPKVKYLNNRLEGDHGKLKRLIKPTLDFQSMKTAYATIQGFEVMRMFKKGQFKLAGLKDLLAIVSDVEDERLPPLARELLTDQAEHLRDRGQDR